MKIESLFLQTEMLFWKRLSEIHDFGDMIAILTPGNPHWVWGNLLIVDSAPAAHAIPVLLARCQHIERHNGLQQDLLIWQDGELSPESVKVFAAYGFSYTTAEVLTLRTLVAPRKSNPEVTFVEVDPESPLWDAIERLNVEAFAPVNDGGQYALYAHLRFIDYRKLLAANVGVWYAAMIRGQVGGSFGLFQEDGFYRYQEIVVAKNFQRQGIARSMIHQAALRARQTNPNYEQVIVVASDSNARSFYESLGFAKYSRSGAVWGKREWKPTSAGVSDLLKSNTVRQ